MRNINETAKIDFTLSLDAKSPNMQARGEQDFDKKNKKTLEDLLGQSIDISWLAGDGSNRSYYRLHYPEKTQESQVIMVLSESDCKKVDQGIYPWIPISKILHSNNIRCPQLIHKATNARCLIIEDYGDQMLEHAIQKHVAKDEVPKALSLYEKSFEIIAKMQNIPVIRNDIWTKHAFDYEKYEWEMNFFLKKFLNILPGFSLEKAEKEAFKKETKELAKKLAPQSTTMVHRDFHSRNLMLKDNSLAVIDFQDARFGHPYYDLVSLVFDPYVSFSKKIRSSLLRQGLDFLSTQTETGQIHETEVGPILMQRLYKAIGSYGYLSLDMKRGNYLKYVPCTLELLTNHVPRISWCPFLSNELPRKLTDYALARKGYSVKQEVSKVTPSQATHRD